jgi:ATP-binding protein involved in chromosome partitioning
MSADRLDRDTVLAALADLADPESGRKAVQMDQIGEITIDGRRVDVSLGLTAWAGPLWEETRGEAEQLLRNKLPADAAISVRIVEHVRRPEKIGQLGLEVKSVIAVGSGKGGVGKSTIAASLAYGLKNSGASDRESEPNR